MPVSTRSNSNKNSPAIDSEHGESSVINIDSDGENQDTNQDAPFELDSEYTVPQGHALGSVVGYIIKGKQQAQDDETAEDGDDEDGNDYEDEDNDMFDGDYMIEHDENEAAASQEEVNEWARIQLEKIDNSVEVAKKKVDDLDEKKKKAELRAIGNRTKLRLEYAARKLGAHQLEKIHKQQTSAEQSVEKISNELQKAKERLASLEVQRYDIEFDRVSKYNEALQKNRRKKPRSTQNRQFPPEHNLDSGDDSLSDRLLEQEEREHKEKGTKSKKPGRACRRCRLFKKKCNFKPGDATCDKCAVTGQRCRYKDTFSGDKQLRPWFIQSKIEELAAVKAELAKFQEESAVSVGADNPLSGVTGYGPPTQRLARQNWALMVRGHPPRPPLPTSTQGDHSSSISVKRKSPADPIDSEPSQPAKRQRQTESQSNPPPKHYSFQNQTAESFTEPSKRNRKSDQTSSTRTTMKPSRQQQQQSEEQIQKNELPSFQFTLEYFVPAEDLSANPTHPPTVVRPGINAASVSNAKLWWAQMISEQGGELPVNVRFSPGWPRWADNMNEKQEIWFNALYSGGIQIPLVQGKSIEDDGGVEPLWPSWTRVAEALDGNRSSHLTQAVQGRGEIREFHDQDGIAQGTVDWQFIDAQVHSHGQSPAE